MLKKGLLAAHSNLYIQKNKLSPKTPKPQSPAKRVYKFELFEMESREHLEPPFEDRWKPTTKNLNMPTYNSSQLVFHLK